MEFRWNAWNVEHIELHGVSPDEAEFVVNRARRPFPELIRANTWYVAGQTARGHYLQVI